MGLKPGDTIKCGTLVLLTQGCYSSYGVIGLFRATADVVVPARVRRYGGRHSETEPDIHLLSTLLEEVPYQEAWQDV